MTDWRRVIVESVRRAAEDVVDLHLVDSDGKLLPPAEPGSHIDVKLPNGLVRQYSVHYFNPEIGSYYLGVGLARPSQGGSAFLHTELKTGQFLEISGPKNNFALDKSASGYLFIAGGIGITPILSMVRWCHSQKRPWQLLYCARSKSRAAYLKDIPETDHIQFHADDEHQGHPDLESFIVQAGVNDHIYCCGPGPLMDRVDSLAGDVLPTSQVHFERFSAPVADDVEVDAQTDKSFTVKLAQSGVELYIPAGLSILDVMEAEGVLAPSSCREGLCRTCECTVLDGEVDHRDYVLSNEERISNQVMLPCVSRAKSSVIVLDL